MRSAEQISRTVTEWHDHQAAERRQTLRELLAILRRAAADGAEWYYGTLELCDRLRARSRREPLEELPAPDPSSPFQAPAPRAPRAPAEPEQASLFGDRR